MEENPKSRIVMVDDSKKNSEMNGIETNQINT